MQDKLRNSWVIKCSWVSLGISKEDVGGFSWEATIGWGVSIASVFFGSVWIGIGFDLWIELDFTFEAIEASVGLIVCLET